MGAHAPAHPFLFAPCPFRFLAGAEAECTATKNVPRCRLRSRDRIHSVGKTRASLQTRSTQESPKKRRT